MQTVVAIVAGIVRFNIFYLTTHHMHPQRAAAAAVHRTGAPGDRFAGGVEVVCGLGNAREG